MDIPVPEGREDPTGRRPADISWLFDKWVQQRHAEAVWTADELFAVIGNCLLRLRSNFTADQILAGLHAGVHYNEDLITTGQIVLMSPSGDELSFVTVEERMEDPAKAALADDLNEALLHGIPDTAEELFLESQ